MDHEERRDFHDHGGRALALLRLGVAVLLLLVCGGEIGSPQAGLQSPPTSHVLTGKVVKVVDGDTIYILDRALTQYKVRLAGIDAPERNQPYGLASRKHLASLVAGKTVTVDYTKHDQYGRIVGTVWISGVDACLEQIKAGLAWHYKRFQSEQELEERTSYADAENEARAEHIGLWQDKNPKPPWVFRRLERSRSSVQQELAQVVSPAHL